METTQTRILVLDENKTMAWLPLRKQSLFQSVAMRGFRNSDMLNELEYTDY